MIGAVRVEAIRLKRIRIPTLSEIPAPIAPRMALAMPVIRKTTKITPKTCQPLPRTSSRERPKESITPLRSTTIAGAITAQIVSRIRPGTRREEADADRDAGEDADADQRQHDGPGGFDQVANRGIAAAVLHVLDQADDQSLVQGGGDDGDREADREEEEAADDDRVDDRDDDVEAEGERQQHARLGPVGREDLAEGPTYIEL